MTAIAATDAPVAPRLPLLAAVVAFLALFAPTLLGLCREWWTNPDAGHALLLVPLAGYLCWRRGIDPDARPAEVSGLLVLCGAALLRLAGALAVEQFTQRLAMFGAIVGLILFFGGWRQLRYWWLPMSLLLLSLPLPALLLNRLALPLQLQASRIGAALLMARQIPVELHGNIILLPGHQLFVTEACSGLRSLTALLSLGLLLGALWLKSPISRTLLMIAAVGVAVTINAVRVFLTGFLVYFVSPEMGEGFLHSSEGVLLFMVSLTVLALITLGARSVERWFRQKRSLLHG